ncbi:three-helix bundle dimerization domain-containing protein [Streptomyces sp. NPDC051366]|uniref:three-helix bundle dimerization domain-containing protein n=1 Tax=Streptomyces sp. NPDC051366 TaxID=3365652 RepID=UPI0037909BC9
MPTGARGGTIVGTGGRMPLRSADEEGVERVAERLGIACYRRRTADQVDAAVRAALDHCKDRRVRELVPVLVERRARAALEAADRPDDGCPPTWRGE